MIKLYTNDEILYADKIDSIEPKKILLSDTQIEEEFDRRKFMFYSALTMGTMVYPTKSEAFWWVIPFIIRPFIRIGLRGVMSRGVTSTITRTARGTGINLARRFRNGSKVIKRQEVTKVKTKFQASTGLTLSTPNLLRAGEEISHNPATVIWDSEGDYTAPKTRERFKNTALLRIKNRTSKSLETKLRLALIHRDGRKSHYLQHTLKINAHGKGTVDISRLFTRLEMRGRQTIVYDLERYNDLIQISSPNKNIFVTNLIV